MERRSFEKERYVKQKEELAQGSIKKIGFCVSLDKKKAALAQGASIKQESDLEFFEDSGMGKGRKIIRKSTSLTFNFRCSEK